MKFYGNKALAGASGQGGYFIDRSLRFRSSASAYLSRTPASAGNRKTWTWSGWVKRSNVAGNGQLFAARTGVSGTYFGLSFQSAGDLRIESNLETAYPLYKTNALFRDPSAWYHIVLAVDMTQATSTNRVKLYVNGVLQTTASYNVPAQNTDLNVNSTATHLIGQQASGNYLDGYLTEVNFIDGQALDPTSFGEYNEDTGVWQPKKYTGTYGTNGFYLNFSDNSSTTTLGEDGSGNGNDWTLNNFSLTSGVTYDSMTDVPTLTSETAGNYATLNRLMLAGTGIDVAQGNLYANRNSAGWARIAASFGVTFGKWYWEILPNNNTTSQMIGVGLGNTAPNYPGYESNTYGFYTSTGQKYNNNTGASYGSYSAGQLVGVALDLDNGKIWFSCNGTWQAFGDPAAGTNAAFTGISGTYFPEYGLNGIGTNGYANFGQRPFAYTPPTGFKALNTYNLPDSTIVDGSQYFDAVLWTGDGTGDKAITGVGFQPDFVWVKSRSDASSHRLSDVVRGSNGVLFSNLTNAEAVNSASGYINSFDSDGFSTVAGATNNNNYNNTSISYVAWNWKANGTGVSNTDGSITSTVSANTTAGFSIVTYTGNGTANQSVGHGLGVKPSLIIVKIRSGNTNNWSVAHKGLGDMAQSYILLDSTAAKTSSPNLWASTEPTSNVFSLGVTNAGNGNTYTYVAYCFAEVEGFSKMGSYTGNGSTDGPFVYTGFRPAFVMIKNATGSANANTGWYIFDSLRNTFNTVSNPLRADLSDTESSGYAIDFLSNGFKLRISDAGINSSAAATHIFAAFAENPFKNSLGR